jgi:hypothetical protein
MNLKFQNWFDNGKIVEALCGRGEYFVPDATYREHHADLLAVRQLLIDWAALGHAEQAAKGFEMAVTKLLQEHDFESALGLILSYEIVKKSSGKNLLVDENRIESLVEQTVRENGEIFAKNEGLRKLLLQVIGYFQELGKSLGMTKIEEPANIVTKFKIV